jgi:MoxR-like ATPase
MKHLFLSTSLFSLSSVFALFPLCFLSLSITNSENPHKEIIIIDEIDKMPLQHQEGLLTMMERGEFTTTKVRNTQTVKANMVIFATSNSTERLSKSLLSRFTVFETPEYTYKEFEAISDRIIKTTSKHRNRYLLRHGIQAVKI